MSAPAALYHFTCRDGHRMIGRWNCVLRGQTEMWPFTWLTTEAVPDFEATGLSSVTLGCDRTEVRYIVTEDIGLCRPWLGSPERRGLARRARRDLERWHDPEHWWVAPVPVRASWDRSWDRQTAVRSG